MVPVNHFELGPSTVIKTELKFAYIKKRRKEETGFAARVTVVAGGRQ